MTFRYSSRFLALLPCWESAARPLTGSSRQANCPYAGSAVVSTWSPLVSKSSWRHERLSAQARIEVAISIRGPESDSSTGQYPWITKGGFDTEKGAWQACREAMREADRGRVVKPSARTAFRSMSTPSTRLRQDLLLANICGQGRGHV
jgi:hypothetical protein